MPWKECSIVSQREEFCRLAQMPGANIRELCRRFGISPTTGYLRLERVRELGPAGLQDRGRRPVRSPGRTSTAIEAEVTAVRRAHPAWGGRKIRRVLQDQGLHPPSASTITQILRRHELLDGPGAGEQRALLRFEHPAPNDLWQMDFKGHFALASGRCHPLTVLDDHARYALEIGACGDEQGETVRARLTQVFRRYGLPWRMLADNGSPWGSPNNGAYSALEVWLLDLGVELIHGRPYHPQTQGKDERFHRTLKAEVLDGRNFIDLHQAQKAFDAWREVYNSQRPHEALGLDTPNSRYRMSQRTMPEQIVPPEYEPQAVVRKVHDNGWVFFKGREIRCPKAFVGRRIAFRATASDGLYDLCYRSYILTQVDLRETPQPVHHVSEHPSTLSPV